MINIIDTIDTEMRLRIDNSSLYKGFIILLPSLIILSQFFRVGPINVSWLLYIIIGLLVCKKGSLIINNPLLVSITVVVVLYPLISFFWSPVTKFESSLYFSLLTGLFFLLFVATISTDYVPSFMYGCYVSCLLFSVWGVYEAITGNYLLFHNPDFVNRLNPFGLHYPGVAFANTNDLAQYLAMLTPVVFAYILQNGRFIMKSLVVFTVVCDVFTIYHCHAHLAMISLVMSLAIIAFFYFIKNVRRPWLWGLLVLAIIGFICIAYKTNLIMKLYSELTLVDSKNIHFTEREKIYWDLYHAFLNHPMGGFGNAYNTAPPHNLFLYILCDFGLIIGILFVALLVFIVVRMFKQRKSMVCIGILSAMIVFPFTSSISSGNEQRKIVWLVLGLGISFASAHLSNKGVNMNANRQGC